MKSGLEWRQVALVCALMMLGAGCARGGLSMSSSSELTSPAGSTAYALEAPTRYAALVSEVDAEDQAARETLTAMKAYPDALKTSEWALVKTIVEQADEAGRRQDMAQQLHRQRQVMAFIREHEVQLGRRLGGHFTQTAKRKGCECASEAAGAGRQGLKESVNHVMGEDNEARNQAHRTLSENADALGKRNAKALRGQIDALTALSYYVAVARPEQVAALRRSVDELDAVDGTLERARREQEARLNDDTLSKRQRKAAQARVDELKEAQEALAGLRQGLQQRADREAQDGDALRRDYERALGELNDALEARQE